jgi:hypothetical protein
MSEVTDIIFYPTVTVLIFDDGHEEVITQANTEYEPEVGKKN